MRKATFKILSHQANNILKINDNFHLIYSWTWKVCWKLHLGTKLDLNRILSPIVGTDLWIIRTVTCDELKDIPARSLLRRHEEKKYERADGKYGIGLTIGQLDDSMLRTLTMRISVPDN